MKKRILYTFVVTLIAFLIWLGGLALMAVKIPEFSWTAARIWALIVVVAAIVWSSLHFYRKDKKKREDEENEHYKGVY